MLPVFEGISDWCDENILAAMTGMAEKCECKNAKVMWPVRIAAAGKAVTPGGAVEICRILGKDETLRRMRVGIEKLEKASDKWLTGSSSSMTSARSPILSACTLKMTDTRCISSSTEPMR